MAHTHIDTHTKGRFSNISCVNHKQKDILRKLISIANKLLVISFSVNTIFDWCCEGKSFFPAKLKYNGTIICMLDFILTIANITKSKL